MSFRWKMLLWAGVPQLIVIGTLVPLALITGDALFSFVSIGLSIGIAVGQMIGGKARLLILENVYGPRFREDSLRGKLYREAEERRKRPTPPV